MIVRMRKVGIILQAKDAEDGLKVMRSLGVLHVEHTQMPQGAQISGLLEDLNLLRQAVTILEEAKEKGGRGDGYIEKCDWRLVARHISDLRKRIEHLRDFSLTLKKTIEEWQPWGDFDPKQILALREKNIYLKLCRAPVEELEKLPREICVRKISVSSGIAGCVLLTKGDFQIPFKEIEPPKMSLLQMHLRISEDAGIIAALERDLEKHVDYLPNFIRITRSVEKELEFWQALKGMGDYSGLACLKGYIPCDAEDILLREAKKQKWAVLTAEPSAEDNVPTLIRNPRWVSIIQPIFKVLEIVPGYQELDISLWFLLFFSVFFGMLIGDAGYGLVYLVLTFLAQRKFGAKFKEKSVFVLFYLLSSCAIVWGILTATVFGQQWLSGIMPPLLPALRSDKNMQEICFLLGAVHLTIAHLWRAILKFPALSFLADIGWAIVLWAAFFLARFLILAEPLPGFVRWLLIFGPILVVFFSAPQKNILKTFGSGLGTLLLDLMNNFTDIVSYIRIFAVGLATVAVADSFNQMAAGIGFGNIVSGSFASLVLIVGHLLNVVLGPLSVLVHGVRLNVLEFCMHLDVKWSGFSYKPLKEGI